MRYAGKSSFPEKAEGAHRTNPESEGPTGKQQGPPAGRAGIRPRVFCCDTTVVSPEQLSGIDWVTRHVFSGLDALHACPHC